MNGRRMWSVAVALVSVLSGATIARSQPISSDSTISPPPLGARPGDSLAPVRKPTDPPPFDPDTPPAIDPAQIRVSTPPARAAQTEEVTVGASTGRDVGAA